MNADQTQNPTAARALRRVGVPFVICFSMILVGVGCDSPLEVETPDVITPESLEGEAGLTARLNGAFGDFALAFGGSAQETAVQGAVVTSGLLVDEIVHSGTQNGRVQLDARRAEDRNERSFETYQNLHRAREAAESTIQAFEAAEDAPDPDRSLAQLHSLAGYTYILFGELYCSGVPVSHVVEGDLEMGEALTTSELFDRAIEHLDAGAGYAQSAGDNELERLTALGTARAQLNLGQFDVAAQTVSSVPTEFEFAVQYSGNTARQVNGLVSANHEFERLSVVNEEGSNGVDYLDAFTSGDPRTPFEQDPDDGVGFDSSVDLYLQLKYTDRDSPIVLGDGIEARLIEAEAALQNGSPGAFETIHNDLRDQLDAAAVEPIDADTMSTQQMEDFHFRERAMWMWLTGHRLGDLRRMVRQYGRDAESVFPSGSYFKPQFNTYGSAVTLIVPFEERNNPNFDGCLDRDA